VLDILLRGDFMVILNAAQSVLSIIVMISIGYILSSKGWFTEDTSKVFSKIVVNLSLPALMISNLLSTFTKEDLSQAGAGLLIPFISIVISYLLSVIIAKLIKVKPERKGTFQCMFFLSNTMFIGLPLNLSLFGETSVPYVLYYYFANSSIFWTVGVYAIRKDSGMNNSSIFSLDTLKKILTPPLVGFIVAVCLIMLEIQLPKFIMESCKYISNLTTPLSMFFIGIVIKSINLKNIRFDKDMLWVIIGRFFIAPLITFILATAFSIPELMKNVFVIQAALPVMTNTAIITKAYNADYEYASVMIAITTMISLIFIPVYRFLLG
jgi:malate permease and related proteins